MAERLHAIEIAELLAAQFPEGSNGVVKVIVGTFGDIVSWTHTLAGLGKTANTGDRYIVVPVVFPTFMETVEGTGRMEDLRHQEYTIAVTAVERWPQEDKAKPWRIKQALINDLLLGTLSPLVRAWNTGTQPLTGAGIMSARISGGTFDFVDDVQGDGWVSAALAITITIDSRRGED